MIVLQESTAAHGQTKPVMCQKCNTGKLGYIPIWSDTVISRRGKPPPDVHSEGVQVKCPVCRKQWMLTIE